MYAEKLKQFENVENLGGKAWEHGVAIDAVGKSELTNCAIHCFHYKQMFELLFKHLLETKTESGAFPRSHKLNALLALLIKESDLKIDPNPYFEALSTITMCAEAYRYDYALDCNTYRHSVGLLDPLLDQLAEFSKS